MGIHYLGMVLNSSQVFMLFCKDVKTKLIISQVYTAASIKNFPASMILRSSIQISNALRILLMLS